MSKPKIPASVISAPSYYNNTNGSLYKVATQRGWGPYLFDLVKRLERNGKKDPLRQEIEKSIVVLQLWLSELEETKASDDVLTLINDQYLYQSEQKVISDNEGRECASMMHAYAMGVLVKLKEKIGGSQS